MEGDAPSVRLTAPLPPGERGGRARPTAAALDREAALSGAVPSLPPPPLPPAVLLLLPLVLRVGGTKRPRVGCGGLRVVWVAPLCPPDDMAVAVVEGATASVDGDADARAGDCSVAPAEAGALPPVTMPASASTTMRATCTCSLRADVLRDGALLPGREALAAVGPPTDAALRGRSKARPRIVPPPPPRAASVALALAPACGPPSPSPPTAPGNDTLTAPIKPPLLPRTSAASGIAAAPAAAPRPSFPPLPLPIAPSSSASL